MSRTALMLLVVCALSWGSSFALMKVGVAELAPATLMALRCAIGLAVLWPFALAHGSRRLPAGDHARLIANGAMTAAPFLLITWGVRSIDSGIAGIVNSSVPLWSVLLALRWDQNHRTTRGRVAGVLVGFAGIVVLFATRGISVGDAQSAALLACATGSMLYAVSGIFVREQLSHLPASSVAAWSITWATVLLAVPGAATLPAHVPSTRVLVATVVLGVLGTGAGMLAYYALLDMAGAARAALVTYLLPPLAVAWGALLLAEPVRADALGAMALILVGVWLASRGAWQTTQPTPPAS